MAYVHSVPLSDHIKNSSWALPSIIPKTPHGIVDQKKLKKGYKMKIRTDKMSNMDHHDVVDEYLTI